LSKSERAAHIAARKEIYERVHPETRVGATGRKGRKICDDKTTHRFTQDVAAKSGRGERSLQLDVKRGKLRRIKETIGTSLDKGDELDALVEITEVDPAKADELIDRAVAGERVSARAAIATIKPPRKFKTRAPRQDDSIALRQAEADLKLCQAEVERLRGKLWNQRAGDGALGMITTLGAIFAKAQVEKCWGNASKESVEKLILTLGAAVAAANVVKGCLNKAETTGTVH
jgi:hypothetical protein